MPRQDCEDIANAVPGAVERVLKLVKVKIAGYTDGSPVNTPRCGSVHILLLQRITAVRLPVIMAICNIHHTLSISVDVF